MKVSCSLNKIKMKKMKKLLVLNDVIKKYYYLLLSRGKIDFNCVNELTISRKSDLNLKKGIVNYFPGKANMIIFH